MTTLTKEPTTLGMPWEEQYGYAQAVKVGDTVYLSGQVSHDDQANILGVVAYLPGEVDGVADLHGLGK